VGKERNILPSARREESSHSGAVKAFSIEAEDFLDRVQGLTASEVTPVDKRKMQLLIRRGLRLWQRESRRIDKEVASSLADVMSPNKTS
jgi:hypothetical protein